MTTTYMLRKHLATIESAGSPTAISERIAYQNACKKAVADRKEKFPTITVDNFEAANDYQKERIAFWLKR